MEDNKNKNELVLVDVFNNLPTLDVATVSSPEFQEKYTALTDYLNQLTEIKKNVDDTIKKIMEEEYQKTGETSLISGDRKYTLIPSSTRITLDSKKLQAEHPEIYSQYAKTTMVSPTLRSSKIGKSSTEEA